MRRAESYAALAPLLSAQLRRGVVTNCFLSAEDYAREIENGLLFEQGEGFLLLLRQRPGHLILNFYLHPDASLRFPALPLPAVTDARSNVSPASTLTSPPADLQVRAP